MYNCLNIVKTTELQFKWVNCMVGELHLHKAVETD